ncbi:Major Facilitator Superfamily protein [Maioricimonas rarisocia]|uniref:Major Facilitator Superfamily protein n=1 Tax=Maioricimonas rarisocia TaxID=2528026 RepID=A0A517ZDQ6_9PLAN|nr:MFS transporter [Maioricimonas rarisocia]QDU40589.1 Major Facilitator Superfamily protein [Maioricimonas rarisocia]
MSEASTNAPAESGSGGEDYVLFWACFIALIATAFGFIIRALIMDDWGQEFGLTETQKGEIFGVGLWPFAISIVLFSLIVDKIGYGRAMVFAFIAHVVSAVVTILTPTVAAGDSNTAYWMLYTGNFIVALGNGTVEAVINPVVATMFFRQKTKWLNILHAGWPGGLVLGGLLTLGMGDMDWQYKVGLIFIPVVAYGVMMLSCKFPVSERVAAGVSYKAMLQEVGALGCLVVTALIVFEVTRVLTGMDLIFSESAMLMAGADDQTQLMVKVGITLAITIIYGLIAQSLGRPMFVFLLLIMIPLATTELGTDSWISELMEPEMARLGLSGGWVLVYTSAIMMILRFFAGPIVHKLSPLGLLAVSAVVAAGGLVFLSKSTGVTILAAATLYGFGKTFFWPTMLGVVAEQFPKGGALTLNTIGGVGMLGVGVVGTALLGNIQDKTVDDQLAKADPALHEQVVAEPERSVFGTYQPLNSEKVDALPEEEQETITGIRDGAKKSALMTVAIFPVLMFICYLILIAYFRSKGGYEARVLTEHDAEDAEFTGGVEGPMEA